MKRVLSLAIVFAALAAPLSSQAQSPSGSRELAKPSGKVAAGQPAKPAEQPKVPASADRQAKAKETASNVVKKNAETQSNVTGNLK